MMKKIIGIFVGMLVVTVLLPGVLGGSQNDPEITDITGDARSYLDIKNAWFFEDPSTPDVLYTTLEIVKPSTIPPKQHLVVSWEMNGEHYASMLAVGYDIGIIFPWLDYSAIKGRGQFGDPKPQISTIEGYFNVTNGTVTCKIPKSTIGNPKPGDVLTNTQSQCFERFRFWGRLGFCPRLRLILFDQILQKWQLEDTAPDQGYGNDYVVLY
jgi:hypothetical protein